ncbi:hypothetical protein JW948_04560 [bacterium]|nr:hypothetical protein [bacterium]
MKQIHAMIGTGLLLCLYGLNGQTEDSVKRNLRNSLLVYPHEYQLAYSRKLNDSWETYTSFKPVLGYSNAEYRVVEEDHPYENGSDNKRSSFGGEINMGVIYTLYNRPYFRLRLGGGPLFGYAKSRSRDDDISNYTVLPEWSRYENENTGKEWILGGFSILNADAAVSERISVFTEFYLKYNYSRVTGENVSYRMDSHSEEVQTRERTQKTKRWALIDDIRVGIKLDF